MIPTEPKRPSEMQIEELFDLYGAAAGNKEPSPNQNLYGAEILRRQYQIAQRSAVATEAAAKAAKWASVGAWLAALATLLGLALSLWSHA